MEKQTYQNIKYRTQDGICFIAIDRPRARNAVNKETADELADAFRKFDKDPELKIAIFHSLHGTFCAGADLKGVAASQGNLLVEPSLSQIENNTNTNFQAPMGPSRFFLSKPVIGAIEGFAVAGGFELALFCDFLITAEDATFGVFCRRFGVPLIDGGTVRLPKVVGISRALELILTGRPVSAQESLLFGISATLCPSGTTLQVAEATARQLLGYPQKCMCTDRISALKSVFENSTFPQKIHSEFAAGVQVVASGETQKGAAQFRDGKGRQGDFFAIDPSASGAKNLPVGFWDSLKCTVLQKGVPPSPKSKL